MRFHRDPARLKSDVPPPLLAIGSSELAQGRVWKVQLDTYEREIERYGGPAGIELAERLFCADSDAVVEFLRMLDRGDGGNDERWRICLLGLDALLSDFGFDLTGKEAVVARARKAYGIEQREERALRHALGERHRTLGREIASLTQAAPDDPHPLAPGVAVLRTRSERLAPIVAGLKTREREGRLAAPLAELAMSFMHMHAIRVLRAAAKRHELVMYELLLRSYREIARRSTRDVVPLADLSPRHDVNGGSQRVFGVGSTTPSIEEAGSRRRAMKTKKTTLKDITLLPLSPDHTTATSNF